MNIPVSIAAYSTLNHCMHVGISLSCETCKYDSLSTSALESNQPHFTRIVQFSTSDQVLGNFLKFITAVSLNSPPRAHKVCFREIFSLVASLFAVELICLVPFLFVSMTILLI